jgi:CRISPR-associated exonuclease Cas4
MLPFLALLALILALSIFWEANRQRKAAGIPGGRMVYSDTSRWQEQGQPLYDPDLGLTGRPDYIIEDGQLIIPVEVKSSRLPHAPYDTHIFQLAAYCLLVQRAFDVRPPYGVLHYSDGSHYSRTFTVDYTPELENEVIRTLAEMRHQLKRKEIHRSHQSKARCKACGYRSVCDQRAD